MYLGSDTAAPSAAEGLRLSLKDKGYLPSYNYVPASWYVIGSANIGGPQYLSGLSGEYNYAYGIDRSRLGIPGSYNPGGKAMFTPTASVFLGGGSPTPTQWMDENAGPPRATPDMLSLYGSRTQYDQSLKELGLDPSGEYMTAWVQHPQGDKYGYEKVLYQRQGSRYVPVGAYDAGIESSWKKSGQNVLKGLAFMATVYFTAGAGAGAATSASGGGAAASGAGGAGALTTAAKTAGSVITAAQGAGSAVASAAAPAVAAVAPAVQAAAPAVVKAVAPIVVAEAIKSIAPNPANPPAPVMSPDPLTIQPAGPGTSATLRPTDDYTALTPIAKQSGMLLPLLALGGLLAFMTFRRRK